MIERRYSCMYCNHWFQLDDPAFVYYRTFGSNHWAVREGLVEEGERMMGQVTSKHGEPVRDTLGWFAHCADKDACAARKRCNDAGVGHDQLEILGVAA